LFINFYDKTRMFCSGGLSQGSHLISFRTQKLSSAEAMIPFGGKVARRRNKVFDFFVFCVSFLALLLLLAHTIVFDMIF
jgi:hypothetical protein